MFSGATNHASPSGNLMDESGIGGCQDNGTCLAALLSVKSGGGGIYGVFQEWGSAH